MYRVKICEDILWRYNKTTHQFHIHWKLSRGLWKIERNSIFQSLESTGRKSKIGFVFLSVLIRKTWSVYFKPEKLGLSLWIQESKSGIEGHLTLNSEFAHGFWIFNDYLLGDEIMDSVTVKPEPNPDSEKTKFTLLRWFLSPKKVKVPELIIWVVTSNSYFITLILSLKWL